MFQQKQLNNELYGSMKHHPLYQHGSQYKILRNIPSGTTVLDVGCASGYLVKELLDKGATVDGVDLDDIAIAQAAQFCRDAWVNDVENDLFWKEQAADDYNFVVFGDVLEHLRRPDLVLINARDALSEHGKIIAAIPNIAYYPVRLKLMFGKFNYEDTGHLDRTHLRFFTKRSVLQLFESAGLRVDRMEFTGPASLVRFGTGFLAAKFVVTATPMLRER